MTRVEKDEREVTNDNMLHLYRQNGINIVQDCHVDDTSDDYDSQLFKGAQVIQNILEDKHNKVFVHCSSGISRGPSTVLTHLCIYKKVK